MTQENDQFILEAPAAFTKGFNPQHVLDGLYGKHLFVYSWPNGTLKKSYSWKIKWTTMAV
jgi:hypothetical protein